MKVYKCVQRKNTKVYESVQSGGTKVYIGLPTEMITKRNDDDDDWWDYIMLVGKVLQRITKRLQKDYQSLTWPGTPGPPPPGKVQKSRWL